MAIALVWFVLGCVWWTLILGSLTVVGLRARKGRRARAVAVLAAAEGVLIWGTSFIPAIGMWIYTPVLFVGLTPVVAMLYLVNAV